MFRTQQAQFASIVSMVLFVCALTKYLNSYLHLSSIDSHQNMYNYESAAGPAPKCLHCSNKKSLSFPGVSMSSLTHSKYRKKSNRNPSANKRKSGKLTKLKAPANQNDLNSNEKPYKANLHSNIFYNFSTNMNGINNIRNKRTVVTTIGFYNYLPQTIINNHMEYAQIHGYDYFILRKQLHNYHREYKYGTMQRGLLIWNLLYNETFETNIIFINETYSIYLTYSRVIWIDFDAIFLNDSINADYWINYACNMHSIASNNCSSDSNNNNNNGISLILAGDWAHVINAGVLIFEKNSVTRTLLETWIEILNICHYQKIYNQLQTNQTRKITLCLLDDQLGLYLALFNEKLNISNALMLLHKLESYHYSYSYSYNYNETSTDNYTNTSSNDDNYHSLAIMEMMEKFRGYVTHSEDNKYSMQNSQIARERRCQTLYRKQVVIRGQCLRIVKYLSNLFANHVLWIEQSKFNANIWSQYRIDVNKLLTPWVLHLAGQEDKQSVRLLKWFANYRTMMNDKSGAISQERIRDRAISTAKIVTKYVERKGSQWKVHELIMSDVTYDKYMTQRDKYTDQNELVSRCERFSKSI